MSTNSFMRAAVITQPRCVSIARVPVPQPQPEKVLIRLEGCGICASNLPLWEGRAWFEYPLAPGSPGHEGWGRIVAVGPNVRSLQVGDRVAFLSNHAFAEYDVADAESAVLLPAALDDRPFPGEPLGCAMNVFRRSDIQVGQTVAIIGIGFLGAVLVRLAAAAGARVIAISRRPFALQLALALGATVTLPLNDPATVVGEVKALTEGRGCVRVIEAVGAQGPLDLAAELASERGRLVIAGYHQDGLRQVNMQLWNWRGLDVVNAHERDPKVYVEGIRAAVAAVASGRLDPTALFTHIFPLAQISDAFEAARTRPDGFLKALVMP